MAAFFQNSSIPMDRLSVVLQLRPIHFNGVELQETKYNPKWRVALFREERSHDLLIPLSYRMSSWCTIMWQAVVTTRCQGLVESVNKPVCDDLKGSLRLKYILFLSAGPYWDEKSMFRVDWQEFPKNVCPHDPYFIARISRAENL